jgi:hypothetical protein
LITCKPASIRYLLSAPTSVATIRETTETDDRALVVLYGTEDFAHDGVREMVDPTLIVDAAL